MHVVVLCFAAGWVPDFFAQHKAKHTCVFEARKNPVAVGRVVFWLHMVFAETELVGVYAGQRAA